MLVSYRINASNAKLFIAARAMEGTTLISACEHGGGQTAMEAATRNGSGMIDKLTLKSNRARQAAITTELMEIIGGAEALKG